MKHGDFTALAGNYAWTRPDYSTGVLNDVLSLCSPDVNDIDAVDVGAGTGIWTSMLLKARVASVIAVEPNDAMREQGVLYTENLDIKWVEGSAESTGLFRNSADLLTMASSFHWADFDLAIREFDRILRDEGVFVALWNPRLVDRSPLLSEIEDFIEHLMGSKAKRVSSGFSPFTESLESKLKEQKEFREVGYLEDDHVVEFDHDRYLGVWKSVNDLQVQLGEKKFQDFISYIENLISEVEVIEAHYLTRAWWARKD